MRGWTIWSTKVHGAAPTTFIILPLVSAFFIDIANAVAIGLFVRILAGRTRFSPEFTVYNDISFSLAGS
jgi:hypothetical protein